MCLGSEFGRQIWPHCARREADMLRVDDGDVRDLPPIDRQATSASSVERWPTASARRPSDGVITARAQKPRCRPSGCGAILPTRGPRPD